MKDYSHPRLHPASHQKWNDEVRLYMPSTRHLPMGSFCGTYGYGLIHRSTVNAVVIQLSFAPSHSDAPTHWATPWGPSTDQSKARKAEFDMMSMAPNFDLLLDVFGHTYGYRLWYAVVSYVVASKVD